MEDLHWDDFCLWGGFNRPFICEWCGREILKSYFRRKKLLRFLDIIPQYYAYFNGFDYYCSEEGVDIFREKPAFMVWIRRTDKENEFLFNYRTDMGISSKKYKVTEFMAFLAEHKHVFSKVDDESCPLNPKDGVSYREIVQKLINMKWFCFLQRLCPSTVIRKWKYHGKVVSDTHWHQWCVKIFYSSWPFLLRIESFPDWIQEVWKTIFSSCNSVQLSNLPIVNDLSKNAENRRWISWRGSGTSS